MLPDPIGDMPVAPPGAPYHYEKDNNGEIYAVFPNVPVFDEHVGRDGTVYDRELLSKIAGNCNMRLMDTGDKCPIVGWHTPEDKNPEKMPPVIGWAEDFRVEDFGNVENRPCIFSRFKVFADQLKYFLRHPRRSVEIWKGKNPEDRFFDPIAVLGAETPKRDLGLVYSRAGDGEDSEHYSLPAFPGGGNTMIPGTDSKKEDYDKPSKDDPRRTPAPKKDQIKGSKKNKSGSAKKPNKNIELSDSTESKLKKLAEETPGATVGMLKSVWRRGAGAYSTSHAPKMSRSGWAMARVNAFIKLLKSGKPSNPNYTQDNDLLPSSHGKSKSEKNQQDKYKMEPYEDQGSNEMKLSKDSIGQIIEALKPTIKDMIQQEMVDKSEEPKMEDEIKGDSDVVTAPEEAQEAMDVVAEEMGGEEQDQDQDLERNSKEDSDGEKEDYLAPLAAAAIPAVAGMMGGEKNMKGEDEEEEKEDNALGHLISVLKEGRGKGAEEDKKVPKKEKASKEEDEDEDEDEDKDDDEVDKNEKRQKCEGEKGKCDPHRSNRGKKLIGLMKDKYGEDYEAACGYMMSLDESDRNAIDEYAMSQMTKEEYEAYKDMMSYGGAKESYAKEASEEAAIDRYEREAGEQLEKYSKLERESKEKYEALERESQEKYSMLNEQYSRALDEITELKDGIAEARMLERYSKIEKEISGLANDGYVVDVEKEVRYCMTLTEEQYKEHVGERIPEMYRRSPIGPIIPVEDSPELKVGSGENLSEKYARHAKEVVLQDRTQDFKEVLDWMVSNDSSEYPSA